MKIPKIGAYILASAVIWGAVIVGCALKLKDIGGYEEISTYLYLGATFHLLFIWAPLAGKMKKGRMGIKPSHP